MFNRVEIIGRIGNKSDLKTSSTGTSFLDLSIATNERYQNKEGIKAEITEWHDVRMWGELASTFATFKLKGKLVFVQGKLKSFITESEESKIKHKYIACESLQFLEPKSKGSNVALDPLEESHLDESAPF
jgi:single-strand DNA-binding protein